MSDLAAKIDELTAALPAEARAQVEADLLDHAEYAVALHEERAQRIAAAREGLAALERGDVIPAEEAHRDAMAYLAERRPNARRA